MLSQVCTSVQFLFFHNSMNADLQSQIMLPIQWGHSLCFNVLYKPNGSSSHFQTRLLLYIQTVVVVFPSKVQLLFVGGMVYIQRGCVGVLVCKFSFSTTQSLLHTHDPYLPPGMVQEQRRERGTPEAVSPHLETCQLFRCKRAGTGHSWVHPSGSGWGYIGSAAWTAR